MKQAGFTLLELLVALVVLGMVLGGLVGGARFGLLAAATQERLSQGHGDLDAADRILRQLIAQADPAVPLRGGPGTMALVSALPVQGGTAAEIGIGVDGRHRLLLRWTPHSSGQPLGPAPALQETALLEGVAGLDWAYWSAAGVGSWSRTWTQTRLPGLVRLRVLFPASDARRWPDIVVAPMRRLPTTGPA